MSMNKIVSSYFTFFDKNKHIINNVTSIELDVNGQFSSISYTSGSETLSLPAEEFTCTNLILVVPGIGYAYCGDIIYLEQYRNKPKAYILDFGWHENSSNQKIFSWYLRDSMNNSNYKTLYYTDLSNITGVQNRIAGFVPSDIEE